MNAQTKISINPASQIFTTKQSVSINIKITDVTDLFASTLVINFDHSILECTSVTAGAFLDPANTQIFTEESVPWKIRIDQARLANTGISGSGEILTLTFEFLKAGTSNISITDCTLRDHGNQTISLEENNGGVVSLFPDKIYVNPDWIGTTTGVDPDGIKPATAFMFDAFDKLQDAQNVVSPGGTIYMAGDNSLLHTDGILNKSFYIDNYDNSLIALPNVEIINDAQISILTNVSTGNSVKVTLGNMITGDDTLFLQSSGIVEESNGNYIVGNLYAERSLGTSSSNFGNIGVYIGDGSNNIGAVSVLRISGPDGNVHSSSIDRKWIIGADATPAYPGRQIKFNWVMDDNSGINLTNVRLFRSNNNGVKWINASGVVNATSSREITANSFVNSNSVWTVAVDGSFPLDNGTSVVVNVKVFLQGAFNGTTLNSSLQSHNFLSNDHPYSSNPWDYEGDENVEDQFFSFMMGTINYVDWIIVELRTGTAANTKVASRVGLLRDDGLIVEVDGSDTPVGFDKVLPGNYYVVIKHRNHLAIMSSSAIELKKNSSLYDFTTSQSKAYGTNPMMNLGTNKYGMICGDTNGDGIVDATDRSNAWNERLQTGYRNYDVELDGIVDASDRSDIWNNRLLQTSVPEN